jgi:hypothetical protein
MLVFKWEFKGRFFAFLWFEKAEKYAEIKIGDKRDIIFSAFF